MNIFEIFYNKLINESFEVFYQKTLEKNGIKQGDQHEKLLKSLVPDPNFIISSIPEEQRARTEETTPVKSESYNDDITNLSMLYEELER